MRVQGDFVVAGALSGIALYSVEKAVWILGSEGRESYVTTPGSRLAPGPLAIHCHVPTTLRYVGLAMLRRTSACVCVCVCP